MQEKFSDSDGEAMLSRKKTKIIRRAGMDTVQIQEVLVEILLKELDGHWRRYGEGFQDEGLILRTMMIRFQTDPDPIRRQVGAEINMQDLQTALETAKRQRTMRTSIARGYVSSSLPLWLNELRRGDIDQFPNKAQFVEHFRDDVYDFDRGIISDKELQDTWTDFYRSHIQEIIALTRQAQARQEQTTVLEGVAEFLSDAVAGSAALQATTDMVGNVLNGIIGTAVDIGQTRFDARERRAAAAQRIVAAFWKYLRTSADAGYRHPANFVQSTTEGHDPWLWMET